ncbi:MAG: DoxX family protein [Acetobacteraceae bacterium]
MPSDLSYLAAEVRGLRPACSFLGQIHAALRPIGYPVMRIFVGLAFVPHGYQKLLLVLSGHGTGFANFFAAHGLVPGHFWLIVVGCIEFFGGLMLAAGLLTRLVAVVLGVDLLLALIIVLLPTAGFNPENQLILMWGVMVFGVGCIGGGRASLDALIGREL